MQKSNQLFIFAPLLQNTWGNTLKSLSWRIDIKSQAKHIDQLNTPTAIVEVQVGPSNTADKVGPCMHVPNQLICILVYMVQYFTTVFIR